MARIELLVGLYEGFEGFNFSHEKGSFGRL